MTGWTQRRDRRVFTGEIGTGERPAGQDEEGQTGSGERWKQNFEEQLLDELTGMSVM